MVGEAHLKFCDGGGDHDQQDRHNLYDCCDEKDHRNNHDFKEDHGGDVHQELAQLLLDRRVQSPPELGLCGKVDLWMFCLDSQCRHASVTRELKRYDLRSIDYKVRKVSRKKILVPFGQYPRLVYLLVVQQLTFASGLSINEIPLDCSDILFKGN